MDASLLIKIKSCNIVQENSDILCKLLEPEAEMSEIYSKMIELVGENNDAYTKRRLKTKLKIKCGEHILCTEVSGNQILFVLRT